MEALWMVIDTSDEYELPLCVGTAQEVADYANTSRWSVYSSRNHAKKHGYRTKFVKIEKGEDDAIDGR